MIKLIKKIFLEPLSQFLLLGVVLYIYFSVTSDTEVEDKKIINISSYEIEQIKSNYKKEYAKDLKDEQLKVYISKKYYEKILLNEAYTLGLEKQDEVISKRLLKQMNFILANSSKLLEPTEEQLHQYYLDNIAEYSMVENISFSHLYFSNPKDTRILETLKLLNISKVDVGKIAYFSDEFKQSNYIRDARYEDIEPIYGKYFTNKLMKLKQGVWHKPIHSKYGAHLVYVREKKVTQSYPFDEVQDRVYGDYLNEYRKDIEDEAYKKLSSKYSLSVR